MVGYAYEDLDDSQFERLVVQCGRKLFGAGVQGFAAGPDGGRDARFEGVAERFPSTASPWSGVTILQAKHTNGTNTHFSDSDFSSSAHSSVLTKELSRLSKLVQAGEVNNYMLFSNRRLGANTSAALTTRISAESGLSRGLVYLAGTEYLDDMLRAYPDLIQLARIDPIDGPLLVSSYDLSEVIIAISEELSAPLPVLHAPPVDRIPYNQKNLVNGMTAAFAQSLSDRYLTYTPQIDRFLSDPMNVDTLRRYEGAVEDFQLKIVARRAEYQSFDNLFNYLVDLLVSRDSVLSRNRSLTRTLIFYMYWHCDIGEIPDAASV